MQLANKEYTYYLLSQHYMKQNLLYLRNEFTWSSLRSTLLYDP